MSIDPKEIENMDNGELARLAALYALPPEAREHDYAGDQLPRLFPREYSVMAIDNKQVIVEDNASHARQVDDPKKIEKRGLNKRFWRPMEGEYSPEKRVKELEIAKVLIEAEIARLSEL